MRFTREITVRLAMPALLGFALSGCAAPEHPEAEQLQLTRDAAQVVREKGAAVTAMAGSEQARSEDTDVVCERVKRTGTHVNKLYCYSRTEKRKNSDKLRAELRRIKDGGMRVQQKDPEVVPP